MEEVIFSNLEDHFSKDMANTDGYLQIIKKHFENESEDRIRQIGENKFSLNICLLFEKFLNIPYELILEDKKFYLCGEFEEDYLRLWVRYILYDFF